MYLSVCLSGTHTLTLTICEQPANDKMLKECVTLNGKKINTYIFVVE